MITRKAKTVDTWRDITIPGASLRVQVRPPTFGEKSRAHALSVAANTGSDPAADLQDLVEHRLRSTIIGWSDVQDEAGNPVAFTFEELATLCEQNQQLFYSLLECANDAFSGAGNDAEKNSSGGQSSDWPAVTADPKTSNSAE